MPLKEYRVGNTRILYKVIKGKAHPRFRRSKIDVKELGIAFRTDDAPIGYYPFYDRKDFNLSGKTDWYESALSWGPIDMSSVASPDTLLLRGAAEDLEFMGSGNPDLSDIQRAVRLDLTRHGIASGGSVFIDGMMMALGGPMIKTIVSQFTKSAVKRFLISKSIGAGAKKVLKKNAGIDPDLIIRGR
jgi:hypothetical protein